MNKTYGLEQYSEFTHYLQFRDCEILNENCRICLEEKSRISFDFNSQIFLICNKCTLEFIKITFQKIDSPSFHNKDNPRTTLVFLFFKDNVFEKPFRPNYHHKKIIFQNSLSKLFEKNCVLEGQKFQKLCELSSKRFRYMNAVRVTFFEVVTDGRTDEGSGASERAVRASERGRD